MIDSSVKRRLILNDKAGIKMNKSFNSLVVEHEGVDKLPFLEKDCRNYVDNVRRLKLGEGDAAAIQNYLKKMQRANPSFFYFMGLDDDRWLENIFWADQRCRAAYEEYGDAIMFNMTYLTNKYDMPFAPFVCVNHHRQSTLLGCGLISSDDTCTFTWLFEAWLARMKGNYPTGIITDQDHAMQNAIAIIFPKYRHRWCFWHIMKKVIEKFKADLSYESIRTTLHATVYNSLIPSKFETCWEAMIKKFELESNKWLFRLYAERHRWVPAFVKDRFWAGMSTTQSSESMNAFFDRYIHSKTKLKQFADQYKNALKNKAEKEKLEDAKSCNSCIRTLSAYPTENNFKKCTQMQNFEKCKRK